LKLDPFECSAPIPPFPFWIFPYLFLLIRCRALPFLVQLRYLASFLEFALSRHPAQGSCTPFLPFFSSPPPDSSTTCRFHLPPAGLDEGACFTLRYKCLIGDPDLPFLLHTDPCCILRTHSRVPGSPDASVSTTPLSLSTFP